MRLCLADTTLASRARLGAQRVEVVGCKVSHVEPGYNHSGVGGLGIEQPPFGMEAILAPHSERRLHPIRSDLENLTVSVDGRRNHDIPVMHVVAAFDLVFSG